MTEAKYSFYDTKGIKFIDCVECERGFYGNDKDKCSCGHKIKKGHQGYCALGTLLEGLEIRREEVM